MAKKQDGQKIYGGKVKVTPITALFSVSCQSCQLPSCVRLCDPMDCNPPGSSPWDYSGKNTGVGCQALLQGTFLIQGSRAWGDPIGFRVQCLNHSAITALNNFKTSEKSAKHQAQNHKLNTFYLMREELYYTLILHVGSWISP